MSHRVRFTRHALQDLERLFSFLADQDLAAAERARDAIAKACAMLEDFPFACRKPEAGNSFLRELLIPFGVAGYVPLFEIDDPETVTVLAVRHQREDDYH
ncbi:type II toxin-antitoxin system RelE/ParE family toxin [uncultured Nevskia sp.]|uniref:type II toxin-antitoxin system RelE/ParE family toxin n=1 Tax=uncultured Nevskia sp. TaxID=228950 RepID=UPI0025FA9DDE|nr:type II toxin-antitoxin system RelE/ParE family toxin [uncultured Nevskia sp.]